MTHGRMFASVQDSPRFQSAHTMDLREQPSPLPGRTESRHFERFGQRFTTRRISAHSAIADPAPEMIRARKRRAALSR